MGGMEQKTAFSYVRISTPEQAQGRGVERQVERAKDWAEKNGYVLDDSLRDIGISAFHGKNLDEGALSAFIARLEAGDIPDGSALIVESLDRLSREAVVDALELFLRIIRNGVTVVTLADQRAYSRKEIQGDWTNLIISLTIMSRAHEESAMKSQRVGDAWQKKRELARSEKTAMTRRCPAWMEKKGDRYELIPERAKVVRRIISDLTNGIGKHVLARRLNNEEVPTFNDGDGWRESYIGKLVDTDAVAGVYQPHRKVKGKRVPDGEPIPGYFPAAVSAEELHAARAAMHLRRGKGGRRGKRYGNLFTGLVFCGTCGGPMHFFDHGEPPKGGRYIRCDRAKRNARACSHRTSYRYRELEVGAVNSLSPSVVARILDAESSELRRLKGQLATVEAQKADGERKLKGYLPLLEDVDGDGPSDVIFERVKELRTFVAGKKREILELETAMENASAFSAGGAGEAYSRLQAFVEQHEDASYDERAALAQMLRRGIARIRINSNGLGFVLHRATPNPEEPIGIVQFSCATVDLRKRYETV